MLLRENSFLTLFYTKTLLKGLSVRPWNKQVALGAPKIMSVNGINAGEFIIQVFGYKVIYCLEH